MPVVGAAFLALTLAVCLGSLPWTLGSEVGGGGGGGVPRYNQGDASAGRLAPSWIAPTRAQALRLNQLVSTERAKAIAGAHGVSVEAAREITTGPTATDMRGAWPRWRLGTDVLGRSLLLRLLSGGGISLVVGLAAAGVSVVVGTLYGAIAGWVGGRVDGFMMRVVDVLYGLPYVLLVVLLAVASDAMVDEYASRSRERERWVAATTREITAQAGRDAATSDLVLRTPAEQSPTLAKIESELRSAGSHGSSARGVVPGSTVREAITSLSEAAVPRREISPGTRRLLDLGTLLAAIGGVSWLTMARVIRGQVLSLKSRPFIEAARAMGASGPRVFFRHLLPNLVGPIVVYATLTVPQAILQESFLSFLGIGVKPPLPSWGTLAAEGLGELNPYESNWWLLVFPCLMLGLTLLAMNFVGEGLRARLDPKGR